MELNKTGNTTQRCFKKMGGRWLIAHEQYSVPVDFKTGKGIMNLAPDSKLH